MIPKLLIALQEAGGEITKQQEQMVTAGWAQAPLTAPYRICHEFGRFLVKLILPMMQHNVVWKVRHNVIQCLHMLDWTQPIAIRSHNGYWCSCKAPSTTIWMNSYIRNHSWGNISPHCNNRWYERNELDKKGKNTHAVNRNGSCYLACLHLRTTYSGPDCYLKMLAMTISRKKCGFCI